MIAFGTPGRHGDILYCLPVMKALAGIYECKADLYVRGSRMRIRGLLKKQPFFNELYAAKGFDDTPDTRFPYDTFYDAIPKQPYRRVFKLHFFKYPVTEFIPDVFCRQCMIEPQPLSLEYDRKPKSGKRYLAVDGKAATKYPRLVRKVVEGMGLRWEDTVDVGSRKIPMEDMPGIIENSEGFIGVASCPLAMAMFVPGARTVALLDGLYPKCHFRNTDLDYVTFIKQDGDQAITDKAVSLLLHGYKN